MRILKWTVYIFLIFIALYLFVAYILTFFPKKGGITDGRQDKIVYIYYDNIHSGIILNMETTKRNWSELFPKLLKEKKGGYLEFGWGDRDTYLNTPSWDDLNPTIALKALFLNTPSIIHLIYYPYINNFTHIKKIKVTAEQYNSIERSILNSFAPKPNYISKGYWNSDGFYRAKGAYNIFNTCNTWTGDILREANITMSYWTPLSYFILKHI